MVDLSERKLRIWLISGAALIVVLFAVSGYELYVIRTLESENANLGNDLNAVRTTLSEREATFADDEATLEALKAAYATSEATGADLLKQLSEEKNRNEDFEDQIRSITKDVTKLDKLSKLDPELLKKYSKVYFLNENYKPAKLEEIPEEDRLRKNEPEYIESEVLPFLEDMLSDAKEDGVDLLVLSAYRSYEEQKGLKSAYTVQYGSGANTFSADQGYSEHQLGTTVDFTTAALGGLTGFENTAAYTWLQKHAYRYGFVISYPENNGYYVYEPWHWRFVGTDLAHDLHVDDKYFYDIEQRTIDTYLLHIFD
ncbi:MAG TPA: M15 family metallopeptidase [Candidatus Paceibacterota bacterium]|nr:M15 family metallopeptidase [Candidatus Paceibacterota bacterium]